MASKKVELELVGDKTPDQLPDGVTKEDLVKADPVKPVYITAQQQAELQVSINVLNQSQYQSDISAMRLEGAKLQQQLLLRDILEDNGVNRKTHHLKADDKGFFFIEKIEG